MAVDSLFMGMERRGWIEGYKEEIVRDRLQSRLFADYAGSLCSKLDLGHVLIVGD